MRPRKLAPANGDLPLVLERTRRTGDKSPDRLQQAVLGKGKAFPVPHDEVVQQPHVNQSQRLPEPSRNPFIRLAGLNRSGRMVVRDDDRDCIVHEGLTDYLAWVNARAVDSSAENLLKSKQSVAIVQKQATKDLVMPVPELGQQKPACGVGRRQG